MIRINSKDQNLNGVSFDLNGNMIYHYNGQLFTGIMELYENAVLIGEYEFNDGHEWGLQRDYYANGQIQSEFYIGAGGMNGQSREWDANGNIIYDRMWINGNEQP